MEGPWGHLYMLTVEGNQSTSPDIQWVSLHNPRYRATVLLERHSYNVVKPPTKPWYH